jgi:hypothetical protein
LTWSGLRTCASTTSEDLSGRYARNVLVAVLVIVVLSAAAGLLARRLLRTNDDTDVRAQAEGLQAAELLNPSRTLVALILAFVLVQTFSSYQDAGDAATAEASAVSTEATAAALLPPPGSAEVVASLRCYARAVAGPGWTSLEQSRRTSPITDQAAAQVEAALGRAEAAGANDVVLGQLLTADHERVQARRVRLAEAEPAVPGIVTALLIGCVAISIAGTAALAHRRMRSGLRLVLVGVTAVVLTATLLVILDLDRPFGGVATIEPTAMLNVERQIGASPLAADPPCDASGAPRTN